MRNLFTKLIFLSSLFLAMSCNKNDTTFEDVDGMAPEIEMNETHIKIEPGATIKLEGLIKDNDGLDRIHLENEGLFLNKDIILSGKDTVVYEYDLFYEIFSKDTLTGMAYPIAIQVYDLGNRMTETEVLVTMDADFTPPEFTVTPPQENVLIGSSTASLNLYFEVADNMSLASIDIEIGDFYAEQISDFEDPKSYVYNKEILVGNRIGVHPITITVMDHGENTVIAEGTLEVQETPNFPSMYLVDFSNEAQFRQAILGRPMLMNKPMDYTYQVAYYAEKENTELRFAPQNSFAPYAYGVDPDHTGSLMMDENGTLSSLPIVLPEVGYYDITINIQEMTYQVDKYTPTEEDPMGTHMTEDYGSFAIELMVIGRNIPGYDDWTPRQGAKMTRDAENKYRWSVEMNLTAGNTIAPFLCSYHPWGWWYPKGYWKWNSGTNPIYNVQGGGEDPSNMTISTSGKYRYVFDSHLKKSQFYLIN
ncbi:hypothetical protein [Flammeovirga sp. OC4]|uniref:hypothetical protein n=1 Tax=Flammeovirga sp. OC4 TaxID=1382345 RepID=UPI0012E04D97|nr:hypothetical protein [Flammeovirga sp. OC4]